MHDQIKEDKEGHDVMEKTDNPYYGGADVGEGVVQQSENPYYDDSENMDLKTEVDDNVLLLSLFVVASCYHLDAKI